MRYHNITKDDMLNGDGLRVVLWVSGCSHCCKECQNPVTWDPNSGILFDESAKQEIFEQLEKAYISGITFSGGDPLYVQNISEVTKLAKEIKDGKLTGKIYSPIVLTGYVPDLLKSISMMSDEIELCGAGMCGKVYKEWVKVSDGGPYIKARIRLG